MGTPSVRRAFDGEGNRTGPADDLRRRAPIGAQARLGFVPQQREISPSPSVEENIRVGARPGPWTLERLCDLVPHLKERRTSRGNRLCGGEQRMLAFAPCTLVTSRGRIAFDGEGRTLTEDPARLDTLCGVGGGSHRRDRRITAARRTAGPVSIVVYDILLDDPRTAPAEAERRLLRDRDRRGTTPTA